jgi:hypothetical protein
MPGARRWCAPAAGVLLAGLGLGVAAEGRQARVTDVARVDFTTQVRPLLSDRCFRCHGPDASKRKAKLRLDTREGLLKDLGDGLAVVTPHDPAASELVRRISLDPSHDDVMPPSDSHVSLTAAERDLLRRWVAEGAEYRAHWSLEPVRAPVVPDLRDAAMVANPIDAFVRAGLACEGLTPAAEATPEALVRRLALNLTGLPPTPEEIDAFVTDASADAYARVVDRYLASPAYGERMALEWLDLARYADTHGYQADVTRDMSPYRDWVIRAFNENLPYDQFLTWQLAGDLLPAATRDQRIATAFNRLHRQTNEGGSIEEEFRIEYVADRVNTFGTAMLGLTLECARCHDHKFDPITQREYFALSAFFNSIDESGLYSHFTNATPTPTLLLWPAHEETAHQAVQQRIASTEARLQQLAGEAGAAFDAWRQDARLQMPAPVAHLRFDETDGKTTPDRVASTSARVQDGPALVSVAERTQPGNGAFRFSGDNAVVHAGAPVFSRTHPFSLVIRLQPTERQPRAIVVHQSRAWTDAGSRGFELTLEEGKPFFALAHFWPGNAVGVRATQALPIGAWSRLVVTYDGSSRAAGIRMYLDGLPMQTEVVRDRLYKDITYDKAAGDSAEPTPLTVGARFRDRGFKQGLVDDLQVFDVALTAVEVAGAITADTPDATLLEHFLARHHGLSRETADALGRLRDEENRLVARVPELMVMEELPVPRPAHLLARGSYDAPGEVVPRDTPASLPPFPADLPRNRLGLARWLTSPGHPLTARVAVNRIWRMHFGRGLVATPEDFGSQGRRPSHPELLDWLADRFVRDGWDVKALHRLILSSATFRQSSHAPAEITRRDPENEWLARGPTLRLPAEHIRDSALAASGLLTRTVGGPSVKPYQPAGLWEQSGTGQTYTQDHGDALYRRSLYTFWRRTSPPPSMTAFDAVSREVCVARREVTATPLQSLVLLNDPQFVEAARVLAEGLVRRFPQDAGARNHEAFRRLTGRAPDEHEADVLAQAFDEQRRIYAADPAAAASLVNVGEAPRDDTLPAADVAAMTAVASLIMNTDDFIRLR